MELALENETLKETTMHWFKKKSEMHFYKAEKLYTIRPGAQSSAFVFLCHNRRLERKFAFCELTLSEPHFKSYRLYEALSMHVADLVVRPWGRYPLKKEGEKKKENSDAAQMVPVILSCFPFLQFGLYPTEDEHFPPVDFLGLVQLTHIAPRLCVSSGQS